MITPSKGGFPQNIRGRKSQGFSLSVSTDVANRRDRPHKCGAAHQISILAGKPGITHGFRAADVGVFLRRFRPFGDRRRRKFSPARAICAPGRARRYRSTVAVPAFPHAGVDDRPVLLPVLQPVEECLPVRRAQLRRDRRRSGFEGAQLEF